MPSTYVPISAYNGSYVLPSDGDPAIAESTNVALRALAQTGKYAVTQIQHQMMDDRGKVSNLAGVVTINDAGGSMQFEVPMRFDNDVDFYGDIDIHAAAGTVGCDADVELRANVTIGTDASNTLQVNATANFSNPVAIHDDVSITGGTLDVHNDTTFTADVTINGDAQIGTDPSQSVGIGAPLTVTEDATFGGNLNVNGSARLGNNAADSHQIRGSLECTSDVSVEGTFESNTETNLREVNVSGQFTANGDASFRQDVELGETSADEITFNGTVVTPVSFSGAGRVLWRMVDGATVNTTYSQLDGDYILARNILTPGVVYTIPANSLSKGDHLTIKNASGLPFQCDITGVGLSTFAVGDWGEYVCMSNGGSWVQTRRGNG